MPKKLTKEEFLNNLFNRYPERRNADWSKFVYVNSKTKGTVICEHGHEFEMKPGNLHVGQWCSKCSGQYSPTTEEFLDKLFKRYPERVKADWSKFVYVNASIKGTVICEHGHEFEMTPHGLIKGCWCHTCSPIHRFTTEEFLDKLFKRHPERRNADWSKFVYINAHTKGIVICEHGHEFCASPNNIRGGYWCPKCANVYRPTTEEFLEKLFELYPERRNADWSKFVYVERKTKGAIICEHGHEFGSSPNSLLKGCWCPSCVNYGFQPNKPAIVYYIKIGDQYKIGITNYTVKKRYGGMFKDIEVIKTWDYLIGADAQKAERMVIEEYKEFKFTGVNEIYGGRSNEMFTKDVLELREAKDVRP